MIQEKLFLNLSKKYNLEGQDIVVPRCRQDKRNYILQRDLSMIQNGCIRHDPDLVATSIIQLICDDLKYQDKQNDPQYLMLNNKLKEEKRMIKIKKQMERKKETKNILKKTKKTNKQKFSNKYSDRIASIREAEDF